MRPPSRAALPLPRHGTRGGRQQVDERAREPGAEGQRAEDVGEDLLAPGAPGRPALVADAGELERALERDVELRAEAEVGLDVVADLVRDDRGVGQVLDLRPRQIDEGHRKAPEGFTDWVPGIQVCGPPQLLAPRAGDRAELVGEGHQRRLAVGAVALRG